MKYLFVDNKIRDIEYNYLKSLNFEIIKLQVNGNLYDEISSHVDIHVCKIKDKVIVSKELYEYLNINFFCINKHLDLKEKIICGDSYVLGDYPLDVKYNLFTFNNIAIHNFKYTDKTCLSVIDDLNMDKINVKQGYSNCSCLNILDKICLTSDKGIFNKLVKEKNNNFNIDIIYISKDKCDINLLKNNGKYSDMKGFIGGCLSYIDNKLIIFGDSKYIYNFSKVKEVLDKNNIQIVEFKDNKLIDYGKIIEV